ncbi:hypothetical protein ACO0LL_11260 [Undibacterium sp. TC4M20W]|uniref:hypothetical protein n=1 Tax=Undibacterium sp. TC4M20W TaxID=3413052 RepID=UPI003BEF63BB
MKNAPTTKSNESAPDKRNYTPGILPKKTNTVTSGVLAYLLENQSPTGMEAVFKMSTTRLAAVIHYLGKKYAWSIERDDKATGTNDGRISWITVYWLPQLTISTAFAQGARVWIERVKTSRAKQRKTSGKCKRLANSLNASRHRVNDPRQGSFWEEK